MKKRLLILTDTTNAQVNGVTRSIDELKKRLPENIELFVISADDFTSIPFPGYKEIRLSLSFPHALKQKIESIYPDFLHIETEWPIGIAGAYICQKYRIPYTTTFHTKFPEYLNMRNRLIKEDYVHKYLHYIHNHADCIFVSNKGIIPYLQENGYSNFAITPFGIDHECFFPGEKVHFTKETSPVLLFVGRVAPEKNIEDFLRIWWEYTKIVVGDGPKREEFSETYPNTQFLWIKKGKELADIYRSADIFVFPSKTDTLGLVNLEAMACGKPVIAYDIDNMRGIVSPWINGVLIPEGQPLTDGIPEALTLHADTIANSVSSYHWDEYATLFVEKQSPIPRHCYVTF